MKVHLSLEVMSLFIKHMLGRAVLSSSLHVQAVSHVISHAACRAFIHICMFEVSIIMAANKTTCICDSSIIKGPDTYFNSSNTGQL